MENINEYCSDIDELEKKAGEWKGKRMDAPEIEMHGGIVMMKGKESLRDSWQAPRLVAFSNEEARPGYATKKAHEYEDEPHVLKSGQTYSCASCYNCPVSQRELEALGSTKS
mmetsp:Transcript_14917/g.19262  ORF Transcript_14917/g.19262 Transcript_14917/m.19262 type:complete len:112 (+) Transcript_14917:219-554(+)